MYVWVVVSNILVMGNKGFERVMLLMLNRLLKWRSGLPVALVLQCVAGKIKADFSSTSKAHTIFKSGL